MSRSVINLDDEALRVAAEELGTTTMVDTVNAAQSPHAAPAGRPGG
jgi:Arc/MetJ family transcription regulator